MIMEKARLDEALRFIRKITEGRNPISGGSEMNDIFDHPEMIRNMFFVLDILNEIKEGNLISKTKSPFPYEILELFEYKDDKGISALLRQIYDPVISENVETLTPQGAGRWLRRQGLLTDEYDPVQGINVALPTARGEQIGIYSYAREFQGRHFKQVYYSRSAQEYIVANFREMMEYSEER